MPLTPSSGLTQYYRDIGAYGDITPDDGETTPFTPSQPPSGVRSRACEPDGHGVGRDHGVGRGERRPIVELRDRSIRLPRPAPRQRGRRAVVYGGRERYGHEPHGNRPVVRQDARIQSGRVRGMGQLTTLGRACVPPRRRLPRQRAALCLRGSGRTRTRSRSAPSLRWETRWALCRPST